uniref:tRNA-5-taurinomethyluridine 2-sulfurtransferase n=1 Tax=Paulinella chromatophora TaxID=39717 RepID=B1X3R1_PAUCH|nr:tRNA (5-methylaminomethyl-2-thiouridylate)- methyltransferase [Paulinella chromatophora]ACB42580.1 tRNA (5-methylaminomethyl-2-thiouridylate)- methyltransferase [Paulinella chromatophora]
MYRNLADNLETLNSVQDNTTNTVGLNISENFEDLLRKLKNAPNKQKIAVGLSGGVDSSLAAALLVKAGWQVEGLTLWLMSGKGTCCSEGLLDAVGICEQLNIPHHIVDSREHFQKQIVAFLLRGYESGVTPLPCSRCNREVKFPLMLGWAERERGIRKIATGHYARIVDKEDELNLDIPGLSKGRYKLLRGVDYQKDQSYFLYDLSQEILSSLIFPLGELTKVETRLEAKRYNLNTANKPESQDLCLADHHGSMKAFLNSYLPSRTGEIVLSDGTILGHHDGIEHFTVGQRKGLKIAWKEPLYVVKIDASRNQVIVGSRNDVAYKSCLVGAINWVSIAPPKKAIDVEVQVRYRSKPEFARLIPLPFTITDQNAERPYRCRLIFHHNQFSITPGQAAVFYLGSVLLGGGLIDREVTKPIAAPNVTSTNSHSPEIS